MLWSGLVRTHRLRSCNIDSLNVGDPTTLLSVSVPEPNILTYTATVKRRSSRRVSGCPVITLVYHLGKSLSLGGYFAQVINSCVYDRSGGGVGSTGTLAVPRAAW